MKYLISAAIMNGDPTFTLPSGKVINLPSPQRTGTTTQQRAYAQWEAARILNKLILNQED
jgi:hypothetical protein